MKLPLRVAGVALLKAIDGVLDIVIKVDAWQRERKQRDPKGLSFQDVQRINEIAKRAGHERATAPTVVLPKER